MSRSYLHTPKRSFWFGEPSSGFKRYLRRQRRTRVRMCLQMNFADGDMFVMPRERQGCLDRDFDKSEMRWFNAKEHPEWMRK